VHFNRCTNKNVDGMKLIELLCEGIPANLFAPSACGPQSLPRTQLSPRTRGWETLD